MTFCEKLTNRQPRVFYVLFCETNQKNKFVNEENNLYQDIVGSHKAISSQFMILLLLFQNGYILFILGNWDNDEISEVQSKCCRVHLSKDDSERNYSYRLLLELLFWRTKYTCMESLWSRRRYMHASVQLFILGVYRNHLVCLFALPSIHVPCKCNSS